MRESFEEDYHRLEENHWWFMGRRDIILSLIKAYFQDKKDIKILEIGCSGGPLLKRLLREGYRRVFGIDLSPRAILLCKSRGVSNVLLMDGKEMGILTEKVDLLIASDVLEHIKDDKNAIREWYRVLKRGGIIICFVPAFGFLWSEHDELNNHFRRYTRKELINLFRTVEMKILRASYWNFCLFFPTLLLRTFCKLPLLNRFRFRQLREVGKVSNRVLGGLLKIENEILMRGVNFPFGISAMVVAQKTRRRIIKIASSASSFSVQWPGIALGPIPT